MDKMVKICIDSKNRPEYVTELLIRDLPNDISKEVLLDMARVIIRRMPWLRLSEYEFRHLFIKDVRTY